MKVNLLIVGLMLLALFCSAQQASETPKGPDNFLNALEIGGGFNLDPNKIGILRAEYVSGFSPVVALNAEYRLGLDKSSVEFHQFALKLGPYMRIGKWSYGMLSAGVALYLSNSSGVIIGNGSPQYVPLVEALKQNSNLVAFPVQAKLGFSLYRQLGIGAELSHYFCPKSSVDDWALASVFISVQF